MCILWDPNRMAAPAAAPFTAGIFFDNEHARVKQVRDYCPGIECIKIPDSSNPRMIDIPAQVPEIESSDYVAIIRAYPGPDKNKDIFDGVSGIERMHVDRLHAWYDEKKDQQCVAVFDWDRTITKIEGAFLTKDYASIDKTTFAENLNIN